MKFVDEAKAQGAGRQRRPRQHQLPAREVRAVRRPGRRRRRRTAAACILRAASGINTLADFRIERTFKAGHGEPGGANDCTGRGGADLYVPVPIGTVVRDAETQEVLGDLTRDGDELLVARGGKGGWGNQRFKSSTNRAPRQFGPGLPGEKRVARARAQGDRRRRPARAAQCRQVDADPCRLGRAAQGRRLPLHHPAPEPGRGRRRRSTAASSWPTSPA